MKDNSNRFLVAVIPENKNPLVKVTPIVLYNGPDFKVARQIQDEYNDSSDRLWARLYDAAEQVGYMGLEEGQKIVWEGVNAVLAAPSEEEDVSKEEKED